MDIMHELETAAKWSRINSYIYLMILVFGVLFLLLGLIVLIQSPAQGIAFVLGAGIVTVLSWIVRKVFINYHEAANNAIQSLSANAIEEVCHYQRNIFIVYGAYYAIFLVIAVLAILVALALGGVAALSS
ncbi:MAG: hypothetical protein IKH45_07900 [Neisseriaceae bacterium]|nr:hypothetical protein [Neisseriaceae bacterium]